MCVCVCVASQRLQSVAVEMREGGFQEEGLGPLQQPPSLHAICLKYEIHNGTSMSHTALACLGFLCTSKLSPLYVCVCVCTFQLKVQLIYAVPPLIPSQNGCCQAEKLPNGPLKGLNGKLIHDCGSFGALASNVKSWLVGESTSALSDAERSAPSAENFSAAKSA